ncbi:MAG: DNA-3-methyladenine glycosidase [Clostridiales bacterium]|jgi:DNA-3-methyladenine glycosylase II|nr:DNA-3-methyladenine glycosidase [Clostridiales bacterium]
MLRVKTKFFNYGDIEVSHLKNVDNLLGAVIDSLGRVERTVIPDLFAALVFAIIGQLISAKASHTIWERMQNRFGDIIPINIAGQSVDDIQASGITVKKAIYIKNAAVNVMNGSFDLNVLHTLSDDEVIKQLSSLDGVGKWTAEMLLINSMERPDVISFGDIAILRGMRKLYGLPKISKEQFDIFKTRYSPYGSVASIYLWEYSFK